MNASSLAMIVLTLLVFVAIFAVLWALVSAMPPGPFTGVLQALLVLLAIVVVAGALLGWIPTPFRLR